MNLYSIYDRLIGYYMAPFVGPDDKAAMSAIANHVNKAIEVNDAISQTPQYFEIWRLASIDDEGNITANKECLAGLASLVRTGIRTESTPEGGKANGTKAASTRQPESPPGSANTIKQTVAQQVPSKNESS